ncbi:MAG: ParB/RepB/Spo0J family partition protein [Bacteroidales bacterium]|nr:ParB/RepB/Spo0J family partition protein [Bacteroidales bacterium]MCF8390776.1 ParB/RepB/Spo0J family partition protein [Bacteroidales bacterium]
MAKKNALGRGLGALIEDASPERAQNNVSVINEISVSKIVANPWQPRTIFDEQALDELADSIKEIGIIQPVTVRLMEDGNFQLITGERRFRASVKIGLKTIPAYIRSADDVNMLEMALIENVQREDLDAIEEAIGYQRLIEECKLTQETLSERVGKKRSTISNYLRLLKLPAEIQLGIRERKISMGHAKTLVTLEDPISQLSVYNKIIKSELSVRKAEDFVRNMQLETSRTDGAPAENNLQYKDLQEHLAKQFGANVDFRRSNKGEGKIVISFKSDEDLERIIAILDKLNA